jgi:hypothetical protein
MAKDPDELLAEWRVILDRVRLDLQRVHLNRLLWQRVNAAMQQQAPATAPATWMNHYAQIYAQAQAMAIRRLVRASGAALSLGQLLDRLMQRPDVVTPERVRPETELVTGLMLVEERRWVNGWCSEDGHLDPDRPKADRHQLYDETEAVVEWVNTRVAHIDPAVPDQRLSFEKVHVTIDHVSEIFKSYAVLLAGSHFVLLPVIQDDWEIAFANPLFPGP